jgi:Outer membrane lipoprotein-sorting protein
MTCWRRVVLGILCGFVASPRFLSAAADQPVVLSEEEGRKLAAELQMTRPAEDLKIEGIFRIRRGDGRLSKVSFQYQFVGGSQSWHNIYRTAAGPDASAEELEVIHTVGQPNRYLYLRQGINSSSRTLTGEAAMIPFANSDFWLADLGLEFLHWPDQRIVRDLRITMRKGRPCRVLDSHNPNPGAAGYARVRSWIDKENGGVILADAYGPDGKLLKQFEVGSATKVDGHWEIKKMEMRNEETDSRTILEFNYEAKEDH